jgi:hypothetical protein
MIEIEGKKGYYELDLNNSFETEYYLTIDSRNEAEKLIPWSVALCSNESIKIRTEGVDKLNLTFSLEAVKHQEYILLENYNKEKAKIVIKPNLKESAQKVYTFRVNGYKISDKDTVEFKVKSECNGEPMPWKCSYGGKPFEYQISKEGKKITFKLKSVPNGDIVGFLKLHQEKSGKDICIQLLHHAEEQMKVLRIY